MRQQNTQFNDIQNNYTQHKGHIRDTQHNNTMMSHFIDKYAECCGASYDICNIIWFSIL